MSENSEEQGQKEPTVSRKWTPEEWVIICRARAKGYSFYTGGAYCAI